MARGEGVAHRHGWAQDQFQPLDQRRIGRAEKAVGLGRGKTGKLGRLQPGREFVGAFDQRLDGCRQDCGQAKAQMDRGCQPLIQRAIAGADRRLDRRDHVTDYIFGCVVQKGRKPPFRRPIGFEAAANHLDQQGMLGHRIGVIAARLPVPARDKGQTMGDIDDLDIHRGGIKQIKPAARQHALPSAGRGLGHGQPFGFLRLDSICVGLGQPPKAAWHCPRGVRVLSGPQNYRE